MVQPKISERILTWMNEFSTESWRFRVETIDIPLQHRLSKCQRVFDILLDKIESKEADIDHLLRASSSRLGLLSGNRCIDSALMY